MEGSLPNLEFQEKADPEVISSLNSIGKALVIIFNQIKELKLNLPEVFKVDVSDIPPIHIKNFKDLKPYFEMVEKSNKYLATAITLISSKTESNSNITEELKKTNILLEQILNKK